MPHLTTYKSAYYDYDWTPVPCTVVGEPAYKYEKIGVDLVFRSNKMEASFTSASHRHVPVNQ